MKRFIRNLIARVPGVRDWVGKWIFLGPNHNPHRCWGVFSSVEEAKAHIPKEYNRGFEASDLSDNFGETVQERDLPVVRILSDLMPEVKSVFDLGGNVGLSYYQYRRPLTEKEGTATQQCPINQESGQD